MKAVKSNREYVYFRLNEKFFIFHIYTVHVHVSSYIKFNGSVHKSG